jgi:hypothetical protein
MYITVLICKLPVQLRPARGCDWRPPASPDPGSGKECWTRWTRGFAATRRPESFRAPTGCPRRLRRGRPGVPGRRGIATPLTRGPESKVARFFSVQNTKTGRNVPNCHELYQMSIKYNKRPLNEHLSVHKIYQHLRLQDPPKFTQILIYGLRTP